MSTEENKAVVRRWIDAYNARDTQGEAAARAPGFVAHVPGAPGPLDGAAWMQFIAAFSAAFPDLHLTVEDIVAEGDRAAARVAFRGTHRGEFMGLPPTGKAVTFSSMEFNLMVGGAVVEHWVELDQLGLLQQLGGLPAPGQAAAGRP
jgi:steroid delta-isomerase-like uncharacterized protein